MKPEDFSRLSTDEKLAALYQSTERTRKMFLWTLIGSIAAFLIPLIGLIIVIPMVLGAYAEAFEGLL